MGGPSRYVICSERHVAAVVVFGSDETIRRTLIGAQNGCG
jgi:hypothetical protein